MLLGNGINFLSELFIKLANVDIYEKIFCQIMSFLIIMDTNILILSGIINNMRLLLIRIKK